jgi:hypothetical protein
MAAAGAVRHGVITAGEKNGLREKFVLNVVTRTWVQTTTRHTDCVNKLVNPSKLQILAI